MTPSGKREAMLDLEKTAIVTAVRRFLRDQGGASAIEYAVLASGVAVVIAAAVMSLGANVQELFNSVAAAMN